MDDDRRDPPDEKVRLGHTAVALRLSTRLSRGRLAERLEVRPQRISEIEKGEAVTTELIDKLAKGIGFRTVHAVKTLDLFEWLQEEQRRPFDPIGPTPEQELDLHAASRELGAQFEAVVLGRIRRENLRRILDAAAEQWKQLEDLSPDQRKAAVREGAAFHSWGFCLFLCEESVRQVTDDPKAAIHVGRLAVVAAHCCVDLPWADRLLAYALAHLANAWRVLGNHHEADKLFAAARRLWSSPAAAKADPGVLDPGRIIDMEASLRKDQRKLPQALELLDLAHEVTHNRARIIIKRALALSLKGSYEEAIASLREADTLLSPRQPRDEFVLSLNLGVNLCHLARFSEAAKFANSAFEIAERSKRRIDILRSHWLRARVFAGRGEFEDALRGYRNLVSEFAERDMTYDLALVTLELAALLLARGNIHECQFITLGLPSYFEAKEIYPEALAAIKLFYDSLLQETATESLARQVAAFLYLAQGTPGLRFVPVNS